VVATLDLFVPLDARDEPMAARVARALGWSRAEVGTVRVLRRALDARKGRPLGYRVRLAVARANEVAAVPAPSGPAPPRWPAGRPVPRVVVVGSGPAGAWAALRLAEAGVPSMVLERGRAVQPRRRDLAELQRGRLDADSNYCFGEGGAGTYSDGKLYTRSKARDDVATVLADLVRFGAPPEIEVEARPHVGSNRLPRVLSALRARLESVGVVYRFEADVVGLGLDRGRVRSVRLRDGEELPADIVVLAVGHSARSIYEWLAGAAPGAIERKDLAIGLRIEHPQPVIDDWQYGKAAGHPKLPPAFYELRAEGGGRSVYSFCMCPGGWIVPAATEPDGVVVNGMSLSKRDSPFANAGMVVSVRAADFGPTAAGVLAGVSFQREIERAAFRAGGGGFRAPAQRLVDFLAARASTRLPATSYRPGVVDADLAEILPGSIGDALREGLRALVSRFPRLSHPDAVLLGVETRTSAPVRLRRNPSSLQSPAIAGLYPAGEGAGYAGGIVSAALDGARVAAAILES
jgi:uncharacterized FAD-dependent dehydrogenase